MENAHFDFISSPFGALLPDTNVPNHFEGAHPVIQQSPIVGAALHIPQSLLFDNNANDLLPLVSERAVKNLPFPGNTAFPFVEQVAPAFAAVPLEPLFPALTSPIEMQAPGYADPTPDHAAQPHSPRAADLGSHIPLSVGKTCQQKDKINPPSRFCHVCVRPASPLPEHQHRYLS